MRRVFLQLSTCTFGLALLLWQHWSACWWCFIFTLDLQTLKDHGMLVCVTRPLQLLQHCYLYVRRGRTIGYSLASYRQTIARAVWLAMAHASSLQLVSIVCSLSDVGDVEPYTRTAKWDSWITSPLLCHNTIRHEMLMFNIRSGSDFRFRFIRIAAINHRKWDTIYNKQNKKRRSKMQKTIQCNRTVEYNAGQWSEWQHGRLWW